MQQGRVLLDADWNEQVEVLDRRLRGEVVDLTSLGSNPAIAGVAVVPRQTPEAFRITVDEEHEMKIGRGRMYVDGLAAENHGGGLGFDPVLAGVCGTEDVVYYDQPYLPGAWHIAGLRLPEDGGCHLAYLDVWQREVTALECPSLVEPSLGVNTTARLQTVWQVRLFHGISEDVECSTPDSDIRGWSDVIAPSAGRLSTRAVDAPPTDGPCELPPEGGYRGLENHLYRVEIHEGGGIDNATFKWARDNATVATRVGEVMSQNQLRLKSLGREAVLQFNIGDWIEITDEWRELSGKDGDPAKRHGEIRRIKAVHEESRTITLNADLPQEWSNLDSDEIAERHLRVRRWDQKGAEGSSGVIPVPAQGTPATLENGIQIEFSLGDNEGGFHSGDYWVFAARTGVGSVEQLDEAPPRGAHHHFARLSILKPRAQELIDCRTFWPPEARDRMPELHWQWLKRSEAIGRAQARYLWILLIAVVFYVALQARLQVLDGTTSLTVPLIDLELSAAVVLASGPPVLSFLVLVIIGALRAYSTAREKLGLSQGADWTGEEVDIHPNAIDFALYTTPRSPKLISTVAFFSYPGFLLVALAVAAWIIFHLVDGRPPGWRMSVVMAAVLWLPATWLVLALCYRRLRRLSVLRATK
jgi:hypothetical protein